ncbi:MAG: HNH endonuclease [Cyanobacteria bacterium J06642_2]
MTATANVPPSRFSNELVVVFSKNYLPINRVNMRRAAILLLSGRAEPLDLANSVATRSSVVYLRSPNFVLPVPPHIRLTVGHIERLWKIPAVSRRELLRRDRHACQYCGSGKALTLDHVLPRSKGGAHTWENLVIACALCNQEKGDRTPEQAGMTLRTQPKAPRHPAVAFAEQFWQSARARPPENVALKEAS